MAQQLWVTSGDKVGGPFSAEQLRALAAEGKLKREYRVSQDRENWVPATSVKGLSFPVEESNAPTPVAQNDTAAVTAAIKAVTAAASAPRIPPQFLLASLIAIGYGVLQLIGTVYGGIAAFAYIHDHSDHYDTQLRYLFLFAGVIMNIGFGLGGFGFANETLRAKDGSVIERGSVLITVGVIPLLALVGLAIALDAPPQVWPAIVILCLLPTLLIIAGIIMIAGRESYEQWRAACRASADSLKRGIEQEAAQSKKEVKISLARRLGGTVGSALKSKAKGRRESN